LKKISIGSGIFTLVFSLNLFIWGSSEGRLSPSDISFFTQSSLTPNLVISDSLDLHLDGLLQRLLETRKVHDVTIKLPFSSGGPYFFHGSKTTKTRNNQLTGNSFFLSSTDLPVKYRNLRI
jgi:hypothetical protein